MTPNVFKPYEILRPLLPEELANSHELLRYLQRSLQEDPLSLSEDELLEEIYSGRSIVWTWGTGILLTHAQSTKVGMCLFVTNVCGEGYISHLDTIDADVVSLAKASGCKYIIGDVPSKALVRVYERRGARTVHRVMREV